MTVLWELRSDPFSGMSCRAGRSAWVHSNLLSLQTQGSSRHSGTSNAAELSQPCNGQINCSLRTHQITRDCPQCHDLVLNAPVNCGVYQPHNSSMPFNCFGFEKKERQEQKQECCSGAGWASCRTVYYRAHEEGSGKILISSTITAVQGEGLKGPISCQLKMGGNSREESRRGSFPTSQFKAYPFTCKQHFPLEVSAAVNSCRSDPTQSNQFKNLIFIALGLWRWVDGKKQGYCRAVWNIDKSAVYSANFTF